MTGSLSCPQCGETIEGDSARFCPRCGYYVQWTVEPDDPPTGQWPAGADGHDGHYGADGPATEQWPAPPGGGSAGGGSAGGGSAGGGSAGGGSAGVAPSGGAARRQSAPPGSPSSRRPEHPTNPQLRPVSAAPSDSTAFPDAPDGGQRCPRCGVSNAIDRTWCVQCGERLLAVDNDVVRQVEPPRQSRAWMYVVGGAAVAVAAVIVVLYLMRGDSPPAGPPADPIRVDPASVDVSASSELPPSADSDLTYAAANTLDGDNDTAWNHDGARGPGVEEQLTYTFAEPIELTRVVIVNGYAKSADIFEQNGRIREALLRTDAATVEVTLDDQTEPQDVAAEFGVTSSLTIEVVSIYPGSRYPDLALTAVDFFARPE